MNQPRYAIIFKDGASYLVAAAFTVKGTAADYGWILQHLVAAGGDCEDKGMEAALRRLLPHTTLVNCLWHIKENFKKALIRRKIADGSTGENFWAIFERAQQSATGQEFDQVWGQLQEAIPEGRSRLRDHVEKLFNRRKHWARAWVGYLFTAGAQATHRIEKMHHIIKSELKGPSNLTKVVEAMRSVSGKKSTPKMFLRTKVLFASEAPRFQRNLWGRH
ncbi:hypothetical protein BGW38_004236 [Lunasporangiospora selenospora]|uniref:Uncharacterized protein n=1 Tax=Lunasporangiospora selenospora TaxID=979761 RepID=A0A9P6KC59_9FUNG|nr:hypothetical protein BGW38_004236 [Lunasporangiospora selenospora]